MGLVMVQTVSVFWVELLFVGGRVCALPRVPRGPPEMRPGNQPPPGFELSVMDIPGAPRLVFFIRWPEAWVRVVKAPFVSGGTEAAAGAGGGGRGKAKRFGFRSPRPLARAWSQKALKLSGAWRVPASATADVTPLHR